MKKGALSRLVPSVGSIGFKDFHHKMNMQGTLILGSHAGAEKEKLTFCYYLAGAEKGDDGTDDALVA